MRRNMAHIDPARVQRALSQRIYLLSVDQDRDIFNVMGSTGENVYQVEIGQDIECNCPDHVQRGNICKHMLYIWIRVLSYEADDIVLDMDDETRAEIRMKMQNIPQRVYAPIVANNERNLGESRKKVERKSIQGCECPICFEDLQSNEKLEYCDYGCGNGIHSDCMAKWAKTQKNTTCVFCRTKFY